MKITDIRVHPMGMPAERVRWTAQEITRRFSAQLRSDWDKKLPQFPADAKGMATRKASAKVIQSPCLQTPG